MELPTLQEFASSQDIDEVFAGYNHNIRIGNGEFYDMKNLTADYYPVLSPRRKRGSIYNSSSITGIIAKEDIWFTEGEAICRKKNGNIERYELGLNNEKKRLVSMGAYIIIMPDKKYINTADTSELGDIEASFTVKDLADKHVTFTQTRLVGTESDGDITYKHIGVKAPENPSNGDYWLDTNSKPYVLKRYNEMTETWVMMNTTYVKISKAGIDENFNVGDGVDIFTAYSHVEGWEELEQFNNTFVIKGKGDGYIIVTGIISRQYVANYPNFKVTRTMPKMDFIVESQNRLWGCRYGTNNKGDFVNEIYASKQGDFKNWSAFDGTAMDSYAASLGSDGEFTGAFTYLGYPIFFKEDKMHKVFGNFPANYQIQETACRGIQRGSSDSLAMVNEVLLYKSRTGICAFDGSLPTEISSALGEINYKEAVGGSIGNKYYVTMKDSDNTSHLFCYDMSKNIWMKEDNTSASEFRTFGSDLIFYNSSGIHSMTGTGTPESGSIEWMAESGIIGTYVNTKKYVSKALVRMSLDFGSRVDFYIQYDSVGDWNHICTMTYTSLRSFTVPIRPRRCDHFRIRIVGKGESKIYSICRIIEEGSDR